MSVVAHLTVAGIFFSKDRREEVIEVDEDSEVAFIPEANEPVKLMTQGQWMKGCPEGGEQSFLFALYTELTHGQCRCPQDCGSSVTRKKSDFFAIFVSECYTRRSDAGCDPCYQVRLLYIHRTYPKDRQAAVLTLSVGILLRMRGVCLSGQREEAGDGLGRTTIPLL